MHWFTLHVSRKGQHPGLSDEADTEVQKAAVHWVANVKKPDFGAELNLFTAWFKKWFYSHHLDLPS